MNVKEALQEIMDSTPKDSIWYKVSSDYNEVNKLRMIARRIMSGEGNMQVKTLVWFFDKMGYKFEIDITKK